MRNFSQVFRDMWRADAGMTLVEILAATAITAMLSASVASILFSLMGSSKRLRQETDNYESLRVAAGVIMQDTRFAIRTSCDWDYLRLYTNTTLTDSIIYKFATWNGDPVAGTPDSQHLHRWVVQGGALQRDDVVGWNLLPPDGGPETSSFGCHADLVSRQATVRLVKSPRTGQTLGAHLEVTGFMR